MEKRKPMGWLPRELAGGTTPAVIDVQKHNARSDTTRYYELVLIDAHGGWPAMAVLTNCKSGHSEAFELPEGVRLTAAD